MLVTSYYYLLKTESVTFIAVLIPHHAKGTDAQIISKVEINLYVGGGFKRVMMFFFGGDY